jgi:hypothetical protein
MATYSCRACRKPLQAAKGCVLCDPVRPHLVIREADDVSLAEVSKETVKTLQTQLRQYKELLSAKPGPSPKQRETYNAGVRAVANALSKVLDSCRKIQDDGAKAVSLMTVSEQVGLVQGFYADLPPTQRLRLLSDLQELEAGLDSSLGWKELADDVDRGAQ